MKIYLFDIDGTICHTPESRRYEDATPIQERIDVINKLYDNGNVIKYFTARGSTTGLDWRELTERQFHGWGVKYHELIFGKPHTDIIVDNIAVNAEDFFLCQKTLK